MFELSLYHDIVQPTAGVFALAIPFMILEHLYPRRIIPYRRRFAGDLWACVLVFATGTIAARFIRSALFPQLNIWAWEIELPRLKRWAMIPNTRGATGWTLEIHDLILSKYVAGRHKEGTQREQRTARIGVNLRMGVTP